MPDKPDEKTITISTKEYEILLREQTWLNCLDNAGVHNWQGIDYAFELMQELEGET